MGATNDMIGIVAGIAKSVPGSAAEAAVEAQLAAEAAAAEAQEILESIPEDYSELSADVGDLKSHLSDSLNLLFYTKSVPFVWEQGTISSSTGENSSSSTICRTVNGYKSSYDGFLIVTNPDSQSVGVRVYSESGLFESGNAYGAVNKIPIIANKSYRFITTSTGDPANVTMTFAYLMGDNLRGCETTIEKVVSENLIDYDQVCEGIKLNNSTGNCTADSLAVTTGFIPVKPGSKYTITKRNADVNGARSTQNVNYNCFYTSNYQFISGSSTSTNTVTAPETAAFFRFTVRSTTGWTKAAMLSLEVSLVEVNKLRGIQAPYGEFSETDLIKSDKINTRVGLDKLFAVSNAKNLLSYDTIIDFCSIDTTTGLPKAVATSCLSDFIPVKASTRYQCSFLRLSGDGFREARNVNLLAQYDADKNFIQVDQNVNSVTTTSTTAYVRISINTNNGYYAENVRLEKTMFEEGLTYSEYEEPDGLNRINSDYLDINSKTTLRQAENVKQRQRNKAPLKRLLKIAHRGVYSGSIPPETIPAYEYAALQGMDYVEADIRFSYDGVPVCYHDATLTIGGTTKRISEWTVEEIKSYRFPNTAGTAYEETEIPTLQEYLTCCIKNNVLPYMEIKETIDEATEDEVATMYNIIKDYGYEESAIIESADYKNLLRIIALDPWFNVSVPVESGDTLVDEAKKANHLVNGTNTIWMSLPVAMVTAENVALIKDYGVQNIHMSSSAQDSSLKYAKALWYNLNAP